MATIRHFGQGREPIPTKNFLNKFSSNKQLDLSSLRKLQTKMGNMERTLYNKGINGIKTRSNVRLLVSPFLPFREHRGALNFLLSELRTNREFTKNDKNDILKDVETIFNIKREIKGIQNYLRSDRL
tara:strand:- start:192 stop:572 length:381 start_codon:yes stop_codon:yes gene_type:complete